MGTTVRQSLKQHVGQSVLVTFLVYIICGFIFFSRQTANFINQDHKQLLKRIQVLREERDKYKGEITKKDKQINELETTKIVQRRDTQRNQERVASVVTPTSSPSPPAPNLASIRIANQEQIVSTDSQLPYGIAVIIQTDTKIEPVAFAVEI